MNNTTIGRVFELRTAAVLATIGFRSISVFGRAGDNGIDIRARLLLPKTTELAKPTVEQNKHAHAHQSIAVVAQCKHSRVTPANVREMEGVVAAMETNKQTVPENNTKSSVLCVIASHSGFSPGAFARVRTSRFPMLLVHLLPDDSHSLVLNHAALLRWRGLSAAT
ncbi:hypothetical protein HK100_009897, partial [Physocladia obscura]